jgi:hypothetical protein
MSPAQWQQWLQQVGAPSSSPPPGPQVQNSPQADLFNPSRGGGASPWINNLFNPPYSGPDPIQRNIGWNQQPNVLIPTLGAANYWYVDPRAGVAQGPPSWTPPNVPITPDPMELENAAVARQTTLFNPNRQYFVEPGYGDGWTGRATSGIRQSDVDQAIAAMQGESFSPDNSLPPPANLGPDPLYPNITPATYGPEAFTGAFGDFSALGGGAPTVPFGPSELGAPAVTGADYGAAGGLYGGYYPWDFDVTQAGTGAAPPDTTGVGAAAVNTTPYDYNLPANPFTQMGVPDMWAGGFAAPQYDPAALSSILGGDASAAAQYDPATLSRLLGGTGLPPSGEAAIPTPPGVEPPSARATAAWTPGGVPIDPVTGQPQDWTQNPPGATLTPRQQMALQTNWRDSPLGALGRFVGGIPGAVQNALSAPGYSSPDYLRSIGYQPGQGRDSLWPGGPGSFAGAATGGESPGDVYRVASAAPNFIPMTGGVGGAGGSFYGGRGNLGMSLPGSFSGLGQGGGGSISNWGMALGNTILRHWLQRGGSIGTASEPNPAAQALFVNAFRSNPAYRFGPVVRAQDVQLTPQLRSMIQNYLAGGRPGVHEGIIAGPGGAGKPMTKPV